MRLLHVVHTLNPDRGGPSESVRMFALAHQQDGNDVEVATLDDPSTNYGTNVPCPIHACGPGRSGYGFNRRLDDWLMANRSRFDGVIVNGVWQYHGVAARKAFSGYRPYSVFAHGMLDPYFARRYPLKHLKKLVYWTLEEHRNLNQAAAVCFTSEEEKRIAGQYFPFRHFRGVVVPYGTTGPTGDPVQQREAFFAAFPQLQGRPYLLYLSRIHEKKGCDLLIEAFAAAVNKGAELDLVMAGPDEVGLRPQLEALAAKLGATARIHWVGMLRGDLKWGAFYGSEAFVLPSHQENFGIAVADALSTATIPLISDKVNIAPDIAEDSAALVEPDTLDGTKRLLERFLAMTEEERALMRIRALACYQKRYSLKNAAQWLYRAMRLSS